MFQRVGVVAGKVWARKSQRQGRSSVSYGLCDLEQDTNPLWALVFLPSKWGHAMPLLFLSLLAGCPVLKNMGRRGQADFFCWGGGGEEGRGE